MEDGELALVDGNGLKIALELLQILDGNDSGLEFVAPRVLQNVADQFRFAFIGKKRIADIHGRRHLLGRVAGR